MLYREIIAVCSQINTKHTNTICGQNVELVNVKLMVHSVKRKSSGLIFRTSRSGSEVTYSCHHNSSRFSFHIFVHSWRFCLPLITNYHAAYILTKDTNTFA
jgi:hypothetical protein